MTTGEDQAKPIILADASIGILQDLCHTLVKLAAICEQ